MNSTFLSSSMARRMARPNVACRAVVPGLLALVIAALFAPLNSVAAVRTETVEYRDGDVVLEGVVAFDDAIAGRRPAVLVSHQWKGLGPYERKRAEMLAAMGYVAFAVDIYGRGVRADNPKDAAALAGKYKGDRALLRRRINAGLTALRARADVDPARVAAIGYCFGGTTVLELARSGAEVAGVVSFHGGLSTPSVADAARIRGRVLALHGADDPYVPAPEVAAFQDEMRQAKVDWQLVAYGGAVHSFTDWNAGNDNSKGAAYNEKADHRSWEAMKDFLAETLKRK